MGPETPQWPWAQTHPRLHPQMTWMTVSPQEPDSPVFNIAQQVSPRHPAESPQLLLTQAEGADAVSASTQSQSP